MHIELLAPAGTVEAFRAAVKYGADAVYIGFGGLNARAKVNGFDFENVAENIALAKRDGVKVYIALNASIKDSEFALAEKIIETARDAGADAMILCDLGAIDLVQRVAPNIALHASTQLGVYNLDGAIIAEKLGFSRVILSRETSLDDIREIHKNTKLELEVFVHGAMCVAFSGNCLLSAAISGNSGTRGRCLQPCRQLYKNSINKKTAYWLSMADLCLIDRLDILKEMGITCFKIEGRGRRAEYVAETVRQYRYALDNGHMAIDAAERLKLIYNRGNFSRGYMFEDNGKLVYPNLQGHLGLLSGKVVACVKVNGGFVATVATKRTTQKGDGFKVVYNGQEVCGGTLATPNTLFSKKYLQLGSELYITTSMKQMREYE